MDTAEIFSGNAKLQSINQLDIKIDVISSIFYASDVLVINRSMGSNDDFSTNEYSFKCVTVTPVINYNMKLATWICSCLFYFNYKDRREQTYSNNIHCVKAQGLGAFEKKYIILWHMALEIQYHGWDSQQNVAKLTGQWDPMMIFQPMNTVLNVSLLFNLKNHRVIW
jgi:hypothetical protein